MISASPQDKLRTLWPGIGPALRRGGPIREPLQAREQAQLREQQNAINQLQQQQQQQHYSPPIIISSQQQQQQQQQQEQQRSNNNLPQQDDLLDTILDEVIDIVPETGFGKNFFFFSFSQPLTF